MLASSVRNMVGAAVPAAINIFTIPYIVRSLGDEGYGAFSLIAAIVGYFSLLDINVTCGSVKFVAEYNAKGERRSLCEVISLGGLIYLLIGIIGSLVIFSSADLMTRYLFDISARQQGLICSTLNVAAVGFLLGQLQVYLNSIPQSLNRYDVTSLLEIVFGIGVPAGSVIVLWSGYGLWEMVAFRVAASAVNVLLLLLIIKRLIPDLRWIKPSKAVTRSIASFSGYAYLSRVAALTYAHADKLIIGTLASVAEVTFYAVPATLVGRLLGLTFRLGSVLFPVVSELTALGEHAKLERIYLSATRYLTYINTFVVLIISVFSFQILRVWLGEPFAVHGRWVMVIMALSMLVDSLTNLPSFFNDGLGFPKVTGLFAAMRAIGGLVLTVVFTRWWGIFGAALSHLIASAIFSTLFLIVVHQRTVPVPLWQLVRHAYLPPALIAVLSGAVYFGISRIEPNSTTHVLQSASLVTLLYLLLGLMMILEPGHKLMINQRWHLFWAWGVKDK